MRTLARDPRDLVPRATLAIEAPEYPDIARPVMTARGFAVCGEPVRSGELDEQRDERIMRVGPERGLFDERAGAQELPLEIA